MINKEKIYDSTVQIVAGTVSGMYANGCSDIDIESLLDKTYDILKKFAKKVNDEKEEIHGATVKTFSRK